MSSPLATAGPQSPHAIFSWYEEADVHGIQITDWQNRRVVHSQGGYCDQIEVRHLCEEDRFSHGTDGRYKVYALDNKQRRKPIPFVVRIADEDGGIHGADVAGIRILEDETAPAGGGGDRGAFRDVLRVMRDQQRELDEQRATMEAERAQLDVERSAAAAAHGDRMLTILNAQIEDARNRANLEMVRLKSEIDAARRDRERDDRDHRTRIERETREARERADERDAHAREMQRMQIESQTTIAELNASLMKEKATAEREKERSRLERRLAKMEHELGHELSPEVRDKLALAEFELERDRDERRGKTSPWEKVVPLFEQALEMMKAGNATAPAAPTRQIEEDDPFEDDPGGGGDELDPELDDELDEDDLGSM